MNILPILFALMSIFTFPNPVKWEANVELISEGLYEVSITANIEQGWAIYSQHLGEDGPIPTSFTFDLEKDAELVGETVEPENAIEKMDEMFGMKLRKFKNQATFKQKIKSSKTIDKVKVSIEFMCCDDSRCLPPTSVDLIATNK